MRRVALLLLAAIALIACSKPPPPPQGRWIGHYESEAVMVDAWLEILPNGSVRISAPDLTGIGTPTDEERALMHTRLAAVLAKEWDGVEARKFDFDGKVFRKPGGVAPQMEWDPKTKQMKTVFYFGMQRSIRIPMRAVRDFSEDAWSDSQKDEY